MIDYTFALEWGDTTRIYDASAVEIEIIEGVIEDKPALPPECWNDSAVDVNKAWKAVEDLCRGNG